MVYRGKSFLDTAVFINLATTVGSTSINVYNFQNHIDQKGNFFGLCYFGSPRTYCKGGSQTIMNSLKVNNIIYYKLNICYILLSCKLFYYFSAVL